jgi:hypothetical protein
MPKFYFDIVQIDGTYTKDTVGAELANPEEAQKEAKRCLAEMSRDAINEDLSEVRVEVRDAAGRRVALRTAHFAKDESQDG